jgi:SPP1 family predicted phage head-tail adaptor
MNAGDLRHRIDLEAISSVPDGMGGSTDSFVAQYTDVPAAIWPTSTREIVRAGAETMVGTHNVRIRYLPGVSAAWRVKFASRYFSIVSIVNREERNVQLDLLCREVIS